MGRKIYSNNIIMTDPGEFENIIDCLGYPYLCVERHFIQLSTNDSNFLDASATERVWLVIEDYYLS